ncbi:diguanylate cyclase, partial [Citrobacter sp. AAK_AS5]
MMSATALEYAGETYLVISHRDITKRKLAEESALELSRRDGLTGIFNRR